MMKKWVKDIFLPNAAKNSVLLLDSWPGFNDAKEMPEIKKKKIDILTIPPKTTGKIQPLDVGFNRYFKLILRTLEDKIRRMHPEFKLSQRSNIGRLLNQVIEQISAPRYNSLIQHAFIKPGYFDREYKKYETPDSYCFNFAKIGARCELKNCKELSFIRCSWCEKHICFHHFLMSLHCCRKNN
uniref:Transposase n=1 Tax=Panagrolaimus davidi TaxID=227884 RepID=A0A914PDG6_9BILA